MKELRTCGHCGHWNFGSSNKRWYHMDAAGETRPQEDVDVLSEPAGQRSHGAFAGWPP